MSNEIKTYDFPAPLTPIITTAIPVEINRKIFLENLESNMSKKERKKKERCLIQR